jgi:hypothetical protein
MFEGYEITVDTDILDAISEQAQRTPGLMATAFQRQAQRLRSVALSRLHVEPGKPVYPIQWTSEKQRRFVMAKLRRDGNLPYQRTGALVNAWQVDYNTADYEGFLRVFNPSDVEQYVTGIRQQKFHSNTGWYRSQDILTELMVEAEDRLIETWLTLAAPEI